MVEERSGYLEDAQWRAMNAPGFEKEFHPYKALDSVKMRIRKPMILKEHAEKKERETYKKNVSPTSYRALDSYKKTQLSRG